jgi:hypothetical protein
MVRKVLFILGAAVILTACGGSIAPASSNSGSGATSGATAAPTATPNSLTGPVGTPFTDTDASNNEVTVTLTGVVDPATPSSQYFGASAGSRLVAAKFSIVGKTGTFSDDANNDATLIGSDNQTYTAGFDAVNGCTNFNNGSYVVTPGQSSVGCVVFEVPKAIKVARIEWNAIFSSGAPAIWTVTP